ncbi:MAG: thioether cross-link-forming SCIFF peptide maturase [Oscillospiraceae bacterium]|jgi:uncharacterized protein|nr:thioether cross-link-forming SCIFF peptide maturase [Oscillospiraceae bacterium]
MTHQFTLFGQNIAVDPNSASIHIVDDAAREAISLFELLPGGEFAAALSRARPELSPGDIDELLRDIAALRDSGKLFVPKLPSVAPERMARRDIKALCLHVAHVCNLRCDYCFAGQGEYRGEAALMSAPVARRAIDFLVENSGSKRNLEVDFFGGEPLLNFGVIEETVAYARSLETGHNKTFRFTLTTNGVLLDDGVTDFCNREISNVVLSLDGRREIHDARRRSGARGSYDLILPKLLRFREKRGARSYYVRGTYTAANLDFARDIFHIADLGFTELAMEPAVLPRDHPLAIRDGHLPALYEQYEILALEMAKRAREGREFRFYHYMLDFENGPCLPKRLGGCGSGTEYFAVAPEGTLYPCHQLVGETEYAAGDIFSGVRADFLFRRECVARREECQSCWAKLYCAGGCAANAIHERGDINGVSELGCALFRKRMECAIWFHCAAEMNSPFLQQ